MSKNPSSSDAPKNSDRVPVLNVSSRPFQLTPDQLPLLVTGIAGVAGYNAFYHFRQKYGEQVIGIRGVNNWRLTGPGIVPCDAEDAATMRKLFREHQFRSVLNCGGSCALKACELDPDMAHRVNVLGIQTILDEIVEADCFLVHLSIDLVYSGVGQGGYVETDLTDPVTVYGKTMVKAENRILDQCDSSAILRISLPMGISFNDHAGAIDWIQSRFAKGLPATLYFDEVRTPTYVECLNEVIEEFLGRRIQGLFHAGGTRCLSLFEIAQIVNRMGDYDPELLIGCHRIEAGPIPPRAGNVTMDSTRLRDTLGREPFRPWPLSDEFVPLDRDWHRERSTWKGSPEAIVEKLYRRPIVR